MNKLLTHIFYALLTTTISCSNAIKEKKPNLIAYREAPLGWITLKTYTDSTFEFISSGLRAKDIYKGTYKLIGDTIYFLYTDSVPNVKSYKALISKKYVTYIDGTYRESVEIKLNELKK